MNSLLRWQYPSSLGVWQFNFRRSIIATNVRSFKSSQIVTTNGRKSDKCEYFSGNGLLIAAITANCARFKVKGSSPRQW